MFIELVKGVALLLALCFLHGFNMRLWRRHPLTGQVFSGILFGTICVVGMLTPVALMPGVIFDARSVVLSMAGLFGGPLVACIAAAMAATGRLWLGGAGNGMGVSLEPAGEATEADGLYHVLMRLGVPIRSLALTPAPGGVSQARITVFVATQGEDGVLSPVSSAEVPVSIREADLAAAAQQLFGYEIRLAMGEGRRRIAVGVRDEGTAATSVVSHEISVGPPAMAGQ